MRAPAGLAARILRAAERICGQDRYTGAHAISHHGAQQFARFACRSNAAAPALVEETGVPEGPGSGFAAANREALAELCASEGRRPAAAYGGASNAYRRWVEDQVRELPETSETAAPAAGG